MFTRLQREKVERPGTHAPFRRRTAERREACRGVGNLIGPLDARPAVGALPALFRHPCRLPPLLFPLIVQGISLNRGSRFDRVARYSKAGRAAKAAGDI